MVKYRLFFILLHQPGSKLMSKPEASTNLFVTPKYRKRCLFSQAIESNDTVALDFVYPNKKQALIHSRHNPSKLLKWLWTWTLLDYWGLLDACHHLWTGALAPSIDKQRREGMNRYYKYGRRLSRGRGVCHRHWSAIDESDWIFAPKIVWSESCLRQQSACWPCRMSRSQRFTRCFIGSDWEYSGEPVLSRSCRPKMAKLKVLPLLPRLFGIMWRYQNNVCHLCVRVRIQWGKIVVDIRGGCAYLQKSSARIRQF